MIATAVEPWCFVLKVMGALGRRAPYISFRCAIRCAVTVRRARRLCLSVSVRHTSHGCAGACPLFAMHAPNTYAEGNVSVRAMSRPMDERRRGKACACNSIGDAGDAAARSMRDVSMIVKNSRMVMSLRRRLRTRCPTGARGAEVDRCCRGIDSAADIRPVDTAAGVHPRYIATDRDQDNAQCRCARCTVNCRRSRPPWSRRRRDRSNHVG